MSTLARFFTWMLLLFQTQEPPVQPVEPAPAPPPPPSEPSPELIPEPEPIKPLASYAVPKPKPSDVYGQFFFREQILDQLDDYFRIVKHMRQGDPQAYALYSRVGAHVMPYRHHDFCGKKGDPLEELSPWWKVNRPAFGAVSLVYPDDKKIEEEFEKWRPGWRLYTPRFVYFSKYAPGKQPIDVQFITGVDIYIVTFYWEFKSSKQGVPTQIAVALGPNGDVTVLNVHLRSPRMVKPKHGASFRVPNDRWGIPKTYETWAEQAGLPLRDHLRNLFMGAANIYEMAQYSMVRIDVKKGSMHAVFGVDIRRTPYFFRDRAVTLTESGHRRPIFHIVKGHRRESGSLVKTHFRGERCFTWNGYAVRITVPGRDHYHIAEFDVGVHDWPDGQPKTPDMISIGEIGRTWQQHMSGAVSMRDFLNERKQKREERQQIGKP